MSTRRRSHDRRPAQLLYRDPRLVRLASLHSLQLVLEAVPRHRTDRIAGRAVYSDGVGRALGTGSGAAKFGQRRAGEAQTPSRFAGEGWGEGPGAGRALGKQLIAERPRTDPYVPNSGIRFLPRVVDGKASVEVGLDSRPLLPSRTPSRPCDALSWLGVQSVSARFRVSLGPRPWLRRLRHQSPGFVRRLHSYCGGV